MINHSLFLLPVLLVPFLAHADCPTELGQMLMVTMEEPADPLVGGVIMEGGAKPIRPSQVYRLIKKLQDHRDIPLFVAIDQEGGLVQHLRGEDGQATIPRASELKTIENAAKYGEIAAGQLETIGFNWNLGTMADIDLVPSDLRDAGRLYSSDPSTVAQMAMANIEPQIAKQIIPTLKHFPGHGRAAIDSHIGDARVNASEEEIKRTELFPFREVLRREKIPPAVMVGHIFLPQVAATKGLPSSLSYEIVTNWLRRELGHQGLIITDDLAMTPISKRYDQISALEAAILAGNDVLVNSDLKLKGQTKALKEICEHAEANPELRSRIQESAKRILEVKHQFGIIP
jgi:beta-N-acetylhexosaminidase